MPNRYSYKRKKNKAKTKKTKGRGLRGLFRSIFGSAQVAPYDDLRTEGVHVSQEEERRRSDYNQSLAAKQQCIENIRTNRIAIQELIKQGKARLINKLRSQQIDFISYMGSSEPWSNTLDALIIENNNTAEACKRITSIFNNTLLRNKI